MIRMSLDEEAALPPLTPVKVSPTSSPPMDLSGQPQLTKTPLSEARPAQHISKKRYSVGITYKGGAKRRRRANSDSQSGHMLPSHFLLGGNIFDPLNLNSLLDDDVNRTSNQETPQNSPLPVRGGDPVEILVPRDITDPLNLKGGDGDEVGGVLLSPLKSRRRHRNRQHGGGQKEAMAARLFTSTAGLTDPVVTREGSVPLSPLPCELNTAITCREDIAPAPSLPRRHTHPGHAQKPCNQGDGRQRRRRHTVSARSADSATNAAAQPTRFHTPLVGGDKSYRRGGRQSDAPPEKDKHRYQYGNHIRYYGYHGGYGNRWEGRVGAEEDPRLRLLEADWFRDKLVLDVGCGAGHMTLAIARRFNPAHILGVELDDKLVHAAQQNVRHFLSHDLMEVERRRRCSSASCREEGGEMDKAFQKVRLLSFPLSLRVSRGPLSAPPLLAAPPPFGRFPDNVTIVQGNYVSEREAWPGQGKYDVIMCLGVTKWVHLQAGDGGVVRLFRRAYQSLSPGGLFILEAQPWKRYNHSKRASETTYRNYKRVRLRPEQFSCYLTDNVGFSSYRLLKHTGNQRPIYLFQKGPAQSR